jgi:hypothetical protein
MGFEIVTDAAVEKFILRWQGRESGQERANYVSFLNELIVLLGLPPPDPADATHEHNDYVSAPSRSTRTKAIHTAGLTFTKRTASFSKLSKVV